MAAASFKRVKYIVLCTLLASSGELVAQHINAKDGPCQTGPNAEQTQCLVAEAQAADKELNLFYNKIRKALSPTEQNKLEAAQRLWVQFRDANCDAERALYEGGTAAPGVYAACLASDTRQRTAELNLMYGWRLEK